jgi:hypothetical protein
MSKLMPHPTCNVIFKTIALDCGIDTTNGQDYLVFFAIDDYNKLYTGRYPQCQADDVLQEFFATFGYLTTTKKNTLCMFSGTYFTGISRAKEGSTFQVENMSISLVPKEVSEDIIATLASSNPNYTFLNKLSKEIPFKRIVYSVGGHMRSLRYVWC